MPTTPAARQTEKYSYLYHENGAPFVIIDPEGNDAMLATEDSHGRVILEFKSAEVEEFILRAVNSHAELKAALQAYEAQFEALFGHCLSNGIFNQWQRPFDCTGLNDAHLKATQALANIT